MNKKIALLVKEDTLVKYGEAENVRKEYISYLLNEEDGTTIKFLELHSDRNINLEQILYIIKRAHCYPLSGFVSDIGNRWNDNDFSTWLENEMEKKPV